MDMQISVVNGISVTMNSFNVFFLINIHTQYVSREMYARCKEVGTTSVLLNKRRSYNLELRLR